MGRLWKKGDEYETLPHVEYGTTPWFHKGVGEPRTAVFLGWIPGRKSYRENRKSSGRRVIRLKPGETLTYSTGGTTDEGWSSRSATFTHMGDRIEWYDNSDGTDCDGRLESSSDLECPISELRGLNGKIPVWRHKGSRVRDHFAEAMGY